MLPSPAEACLSAPVVRDAKPCVHPNPVRRCDLDSLHLCAFFCEECGRIGFRHFSTPKHPLKWKGKPQPSSLERYARNRFAEERKLLSHPPLVPPSFTRWLAIESRGPR